MSCNSMTGFGQARLDGAQFRVLMELRTVNHRFCEWNVRLPRELLGLEAEVRTYLAARVARGRGDLFVTLEPTVQRSAQVHVDWSVVDALDAAYRQASERYSSPFDAGAAALQWFTLPDVIRVERPPIDAEMAGADVLAALEIAADALVENRRREGQRIAVDMGQKLLELRSIVQRMEAASPEVSAVHQHRLRKRMSDFTGDVDESRLLTEVAVLMDRMSIDEELVRLASHLDEYDAALATDGPVGRRLDFIVQEMHREVNTIGSKANHLSISKWVVDAKVIIEQLREQAQNVE